MNTGETPQADPAEVTEVQETPSIRRVGQQLRDAREAKGLNVAEIAARLKLTQRQIEALEADEQTTLPSAIVRGFVRNYARLLEIDPAPLMQQLDQENRPETTKLEISVGTRVPDENVSHRRDRLRVASGLLVLLLAVLAYFFPPMTWWQTTLDTLNTLSNQRETSVAPTPSEAPEPRPAPPESSTPPAAESTPPEPAHVPASTPAPTPEVPPSPAPTATPVSAAPVAPASPPPPAAARPGERAMLQFSFTKGSWVEVRDRSGEVIHSQLNQAGSTREIEGQPPFTLIIGNASQVTLKYRGKPVDLTKRSKEDVARITLE